MNSEKLSIVPSIGKGLEFPRPFNEDDQGSVVGKDRGKRDRLERFCLLSLPKTGIG